MRFNLCHNRAKKEKCVFGNHNVNHFYLGVLLSVYSKLSVLWLYIWRIMYIWRLNWIITFSLEVVRFRWRFFMAAWEENRYSTVKRGKGTHKGKNTYRKAGVYKGLPRINLSFVIGNVTHNYVITQTCIRSDASNSIVESITIVECMMFW